VKERVMTDYRGHIPSQDDLLRRICGEYREMPGLRLKREQAQRLWGLDGQTCGYLLDVLVRSGFLCQLANGSYGRVTEDPVRRAS
jgi:hypothetical protein